MAFTAPVVESPVSGTTGADHRAPICVVIDEHNVATDLASDASVGIQVPAQKLEDATAAGGWTSPTKLLTTNGLQTDMAGATAVTQMNRVNFRGYGSWPSSGLIVRDVEPLCYAGMNGGGGSNNAAYVFWATSYAGRHRANTIFTGPWSGSGGATLASTYGTRPVAIKALLRELLGTYYTIGQLQALLDEPDPDEPGNADLANFRVAVRPYSYYGYQEAGYHAAGCQLKLSYYTSTPRYQAGFEVQVSTDSGFATTTWTGSLYGRGRLIAIPEGSLSGGTLYYVRARRWSDEATPDVSAWSATASFTTVAGGRSLLVHSPGKGALVYELHWGFWLLGAKCRLDARGTRTYAMKLDRSALPIGNWWIGGIEENGRLETYTEKTSFADTEATARSWFLDEVGADGDDLTFYIRPPNAPGGFESFGLMLVLVQPVSDTSGIRCGPGMRYTADPWVKAHPSVTYAITDVTAEAVATPQGTLVLANQEWLGDTNRRRVFDLVLAEPDVFGNAPGLVGYRRRIRAALCGTPDFPIPYEERLHLFDGLFSWDEGATVAVDQASFKVHGRSEIEATLYYRSDYIDASAPNPDPAQIGQSPEDAQGAAKGLEPIYVGGGNRWRVGRHVTGISEWRVNGNVTGFTFDAAMHTVIESGSASPTQYRRAYDVSSTSSTGAVNGYPTDLALEVLDDHAGYPATDIVTTTFDAIKTWHASFITSYPGLAACAVPVTERQTSGLEVLQQIENAGAFHICRTPSGQVVATRMVPPTVDSATVFLLPSDFLTEPVAAVDSTRLGQYVAITYSNKTPTPAGGGGGEGYTGKLVASGNYPTAQLKANSVREIQSAHTQQWTGADWVWQQLRPFEARRTYKVDVSRRAAFAFAGGSVVLSFPKGKTEDGIIDFELCKVLSLKPALPSCDRWELECEWVRRIDAADRPFRGATL